MKKVFLALAICIIITLSAAGCSSDSRAQDNGEPGNTPQSNLSGVITESIEIKEPEVSDAFLDIKVAPSESIEPWQKAYAAFLRNFPIPDDYEVSEFSLRDLDNSGIPELVICQVYSTDSGTKKLITVYSYDGSVYKAGEYSGQQRSAALRISSNPMYSGLFTLWWGGGVEHYGYLTVKEGKLEYEDLWYDDHSPVSQQWQQVEISDDKQLIKESIDANPPYEYTENLFEMYLINDDNITEIIE